VLGSLSAPRLWATTRTRCSPAMAHSTARRVLSRPTKIGDHLRKQNAIAHRKNGDARSGGNRGLNSSDADVPGSVAVGWLG
jgi:hypothetical protein